MISAFGASEATSIEARLSQFRDDFLRGAGRQSETWTLYPGGRPTTLRVVFSGLRLADGNRMNPDRRVCGWRNRIPAKALGYPLAVSG